MGGAVGGIVDAVTSPAKLVGSALGQVPVVGNVLGPAASIAMGVNPFTAIGSQIAGNIVGAGLGGGGSGSSSSSTPTYSQPNLAYGTNTYTYGDTPVDTSKYFITGDKGVYNILPALGKVNTNYQNSQISPVQAIMLNSQRKNMYTPYEAYQDISAQMANDPTALAAFQKQFALTPYQINSNPKQQSYFSENPLSSQYVDFGLLNSLPGDKTMDYNAIADYAQKQNNPFFVPYENSGLQTSYFTPSEAALAGNNGMFKSLLGTPTKPTNTFFNRQSKSTINNNQSNTNTSKGK